MSANQTTRMYSVQSTLRSLWLQKWRTLGVSLGARMRLYEQFAFFLAQRIPVPTMLTSMIDVLTMRGRVLRWLLESWASQKGRSLWESMARNVPAIDIVTIQAASAKGDLARGFRQAHKMLAAQLEMRNAVLLLVLTTLPMAAICVFIIYRMAVDVTPKIDRMIGPDVALPDTVTSFIWFSKHVVSFGLYYLIGAIVFGVLVFYSLSRWQGTRLSGKGPGNWRGQIRHFLDRFVPPYSLYRAYVSSSVTTAVSGMIEADYPMADAIRAIGQSGSTWVRGHTDAIERGMRSGSADYGDALVRSGLYAPAVEDEIMLVSRSGSVTVLLPVLADRILAKTIGRFKAAAAAGGLIMIGLVAGFALWMVFAMFDMTDAYQASFEARMQR